MLKTTEPKTATRKTNRNGAIRGEVRNNQTQYLSRAVTKSLEILELLHARQAPMPLNEIARQIKLSKTSTFRLLSTLQASG